MAKTSIKQMFLNTFSFTNLWGSIIPMQAIGFYSIYCILTGTAIEYWYVYTFIGYVLLAMLGISAGYHRLFSHKGFKTNTFIKRTLLWLGMIAGQGSPIFWIGIHRGYHHRFADKIGDAHSPKDGFWHSYILWMFKRNSMSIRSVIDLVKDPDMAFAHRHYIKIFWITHLFFCLINFKLWLFLLGFPAFITLHSFLAQTSLTHIKWLGYRNFETKDDSVNSIWLFPFILGEAWHNNHHGNGRNPNFGLKWWEFDPTYYIIKMIEKK